MPASESVVKPIGLLLSLALFISSCGGSGSSVNSPLEASLSVPDSGSVAPTAITSALPVDWSHGPFMEIYVRGYKDSNGDGIGDLKGLISKLDYLKDLGIKGIWLMPVTDSSDRDHGYAVKNYRNIETDYGTLADMDELLNQAHQRGMGVIIDYVINHSSNMHPLFRNSASSPSHPQRNHYVWDSNPSLNWNVFGSFPWHLNNGSYYFGAFHHTMPDFNWNNSAVETFHHDNLRFWLNKGVDGMRFDAVGNLIENGPTAYNNQPQNHQVMNRVAQVLGGYVNRYLVCESPSAGQAFAAASSCGAAFAFDLKDAMLSAIKSPSASGVQYLADYFKTAPSTMATFLSNHDSFAGNRLWDQFSGNLELYQLAAALYLTLPGTPFIYYGEEIGMSNGTGLTGDWALRTPMSWSASASGFTSGTPFRNLSANISTQNVDAQQVEATSLLNHYKTLISLRNERPSLQKGTYQNIWTQGLVMGFERKWGNQSTWVLINFGDATATVNLSNFPPNTTLTPRFGTTEIIATNTYGSSLKSISKHSILIYTE